MDRPSTSLNPGHSSVFVWAAIALAAGSAIWIVALTVTEAFSDLLTVWRTDKFALGFDGSAAVGLMMIVAGLILLAGVRQPRLRVTPTAATTGLLLLLVMPGVIFASYDLENGWIARVGYSGGFLAFSAAALLLENAVRRSSMGAEDPAPLQLLNMPRFTKLFLLTGAAGLVGVIAVGGLDRAGIFGVFSQLSANGFDYEMTRAVAEERYTKYSGSRGILSVIAEYAGFALLPTIGVALILESRKTRARLYGLAGLGVIAISIIAVIGSASRLQLGRMILYFGVVWLMFGKPSWKIVATVGALVFSTLVSMTVLLGRMAGGDSVSVVAVMAVNRVLERALLTKGYVSSLVVDYFPSIEPYLSGHSIVMRVLGIAEPGESLAERMHRYLFGVPGTAGPQAFGEAYANYGPVALVPCGLMLGLIVHGATLGMRRLKSIDSWAAAVLAYAVLAIGYLGYSDLGAPRAMGLHVVLLFWLCVVLASAVTRYVERQVLGIANGDVFSAR